MFFAVVTAFLYYSIQDVFAIYGQVNPDDNKTTVFLNNLLADYDHRIRPNFNGPPVNVTMSIHVLSLGSIAETTMDYKATIFLRQNWKDPRLTFTQFDNVTLDPSFLKTLWVPDTFIVNEKSATFHLITKENKLVRLGKDGSILYSARLSVTLSCPMDLHQFPMDQQKCVIQLESYAYTEADVIFKWTQKDALGLDKQINLPQFSIATFNVSFCERNYTTGAYPCLEARFYLRRQMGYYLIQTYVPSLLIVILSWVSFWISAEASPARVALGITTVLTMTTQSSGALQSLPKVSYVKAIDLWMAVCLLFVFAALIEFAAVNYVSRKVKKRKLKRRRKERQLREGRQKNNSHFNSTLHNRSACEYTYIYESKAEPALRPDCHQLPIIVGKVYENCATDELLTSVNQTTTTKQDPIEDTVVIDSVSRITFPISFLIFNAIYWLSYMRIF